MEDNYVQQVYQKRVTCSYELLKYCFNFIVIKTLCYTVYYLFYRKSYTNDPFLNTCMVFLHLDTKSSIFMYSLVKMNNVI